MPRQIIDLSIICSDQTEGIEIKLQDNPPVYLDQQCYAYDLDIKSHIGTYFEASAHVFRDGKTTNQIPLDKLILPARCIRITKTKPCITSEDLDSLCSDIESETSLLVDTGDDSAKYFSRDAAQWMAEKKIALMGSNLPKYDTGFENPTGFFIDLFKAEIPIIANLTNLDKLPERNFALIALPLKIEGICTCPARVIAVIDT